MAEVKLQEVCKVYGNKVKAVKEFNLTVRDGEFIVLVGPSGCGKSTTLRMIAGLETITSGNIYIDGVLVNELEPKDRDIAMVFQNYALYPHMSVKDNLSYSLKCHHVKREIIEEKVKEVSQILELDGLLERKPKELSGGQRQRVALGRALIRDPKVFLFDEPLSNLDAALRVQMRSEITKLHERVKGTFIYVTHDQTEAMTMGDRIVVMKDGVIQQVDTPENLYEHPVNTFVATFLGSPQMNILEGKLSDRRVTLGDSDIHIDLLDSTVNKFQLSEGEEEIPVKVGIRPQDFELTDEEHADLTIDKLELVEKLGDQTIIYFLLPGRDSNTLATLNLPMGYKVQCPVYLKIDKERIHLFREDGTSLLKKQDVNYIRVKLKHVGTGESESESPKLTYIESDQDILFPDYEDRLIHEGIVDECYLGVSSDDIVVGGAQDALTITAKVLSSDIYEGQYLYYAKTDRSPNLITFFASQERRIPDGSEVTLSIRISDHNLFDDEFHPLTIKEKVHRPLIDVNLELIGHNYYAVSDDERIYHSRYLQIVSIDQFRDSLILNVTNGTQDFTLVSPINDSLYVGELLYTKRRKESRKPEEDVSDGNGETSSIEASKKPSEKFGFSLRNLFRRKKKPVAKEPESED